MTRPTAAALAAMTNAEFEAWVRAEFDPDPLTPPTGWDEVDGMCPNCITPWKCNGPHLSDETVAGRRHARYRDWRSMDDEPPSRLLLWVLVAFLVFVLGVVAVAVWARS